MAKRRAHIIVEGRVQGVYFRSSMKEEADSYGVTGWVRNLPSGAVEAVAEGESGALDALIAWSKHGPSRAAVDHVTVEWREPTGEFQGFSVRR